MLAFHHLKEVYRHMSPTIGVYHRFSQITGRTVSVAQLVQKLGKLKLSDVIRLLVRLMCLVNAEEGKDLDKQIRMADAWLSPELRTSLASYLKRKDIFPGCVFHPRQIRLAFQMAVLSCLEEAPDCQGERLAFAVGECCLMTNDLLHDIEPKEAMGEGPDEANRWMAATLVPIIEFPQGMEVLARARSFWFEIPKVPAIQRRFQELKQSTFETYLWKKSMAILPGILSDSVHSLRLLLRQWYADTDLLG